MVGLLVVSLSLQQPFPSSPVFGCGDVLAMEKKEVLDDRCMVAAQVLIEPRVACVRCGRSLSSFFLVISQVRRCFMPRRGWSAMEVPNGSVRFSVDHSPT